VFPMSTHVQSYGCVALAPGSQAPARNIVMTIAPELWASIRQSQMTRMRRCLYPIDTCWRWDEDVARNTQQDGGGRIARNSLFDGVSKPARKRRKPRHTRINFAKKKWTPRALLYYWANAESADADHELITTCKDRNCVFPNHQRVVTRQEVAEHKKREADAASAVRYEYTPETRSVEDSDADCCFQNAIHCVFSKDDAARLRAALYPM